MSREPIRKLKTAGLLKETTQDYFNRLREAELSPERKVAWCTSVGPAELLYALGFRVFFPENHAAMIGASKQAQNYIPLAAAVGYSPEICSYLTSDIGAFLAGKTPLSAYGLDRVPAPDVLCFNTNQCRDVQHWFRFYGDRFGVPVVGIHTPLGVHDLTEGIVADVADQLRGLVPLLEKVSGQTFDPDRFSEAVGLSKEACSLWRQILETAKQTPAPLNFFDASIHMGPVVTMRGTQHAVDYYRELLAELETRVAEGVGAVPVEKYRLYWEGMPIWGRLKMMAGLLAANECCCVASTYCNSWVFDALDPTDPFGSSALAYTKLFIARSDPQKETELARLLDEYRIDGIVYHEAKTCQRNTNTLYGLPARLREKTGVPYLELNGDLNDLRCFNDEQAAFAVETFVGQLAQRR